MFFWVVTILLALLAVATVVLPLLRRGSEVREAIEYDKAMYRARLEEIDRDLELGRLDEAEAHNARAEEGRKLLALAGDPAQARAEDGHDEGAAAGISPAAGARKGHLAAAIAAVILVPLAAYLLYVPVGNPQLPDQALADRLNADPSGQSIDELLARAEGHLSTSPDDVTGWRVVAPIYLRMGRYDDAARAWANVMRLEPQAEGVRATLAETLMAASGGVVTEQARRLFTEELTIDPSSMKARFYLALALGQEGRHAEAVEAWQVLIADSPADAPWVEPARGFLATSAREAGIDLATAPEAGSDEGEATQAPGPTREQVEAAAQMSATDRMEMIRGMVEGLAGRLEDDPSDKDGWLRLVRAYGVLGEQALASEAVKTALTHHGSDAGFAAAIGQALADAAGGPQGGGNAGDATPQAQ